MRASSKHIVFFCGIDSTWDTPVCCHFAICRTKSTQSATLRLFFITDRAAVFTSILQDRYSLFIPPRFAHTAHSPSLRLPSAVTHVLFFQNARQMTSHWFVPGRVDSAKKQCVYYWATFKRLSNGVFKVKKEHRQLEPTPAWILITSPPLYHLCYHTTTIINDTTQATTTGLQFSPLFATLFRP